MVYIDNEEEELQKPMMRPNDVCTAAFYNDVSKLKKLLSVEEVEPEPPLPDEYNIEEAAAEFDDMGIEIGDEDHEDPEIIEEAQERAERRLANEIKIRSLLTQMDRIVTRLSPVHVKYFGLFVHLDEVVSDKEEGYNNNIINNNNNNDNNNNKVQTSEKRMKSSNRTGETVSRKVLAYYKPSPYSDIPATPLMWAVLGRSHEAIRLLVSMGADNYIPEECEESELPSVDTVAKHDREKENTTTTTTTITITTTDDCVNEAEYTNEAAKTQCSSDKLREEINKIRLSIYTRTEATPGAPVCRCPVFNITAEDIAIANKSYQSLDVLRKARQEFLVKEDLRKEQEYTKMKTKMERYMAVAAFRTQKRASELIEENDENDGIRYVDEERGDDVGDDGDDGDE